jgi:hypothetical protein
VNVPLITVTPEASVAGRRDVGPDALSRLSWRPAEENSREQFRNDESVRWTSMPTCTTRSSGTGSSKRTDTQPRCGGRRPVLEADATRNSMSAVYRSSPNHRRGHCEDARGAHSDQTWTPRPPTGSHLRPSTWASHTQCRRSSKALVTATTTILITDHTSTTDTASRHLQQTYTVE